MTTQESTITPEECAEEVKLMARRTALLFYYFASTLLEELGEEEGKRLIQKAVWAYGEHCGRVVREQVEAIGLPPTNENFSKVRDLPNYGWEIDFVTYPDGEVRPIAKYCPLAATFKELGPRGQEIGRMYCYIDQAKQHAYDSEFEFVHPKNVLNGDPYCEFLIVPRKEHNGGV